MPLYIEDDTVTALIDELATARGLTKQDAVRQAVQAELDRLKHNMPAQEWLEAFWRAHPLPPPTGLLADKAFFDELSGDL